MKPALSRHSRLRDVRSTMLAVECVYYKLARFTSLYKSPAGAAHKRNRTCGVKVRCSYSQLQRPTGGRSVAEKMEQASRRYRLPRLLSLASECICVNIKLSQQLFRQNKQSDESSDANFVPHTETSKQNTPSAPTILVPLTVALRFARKRASTREYESISLAFPILCLFIFIGEL